MAGPSPPSAVLSALDAAVPMLASRPAAIDRRPRYTPPRRLAGRWRCARGGRRRGCAASTSDAVNYVRRYTAPQTSKRWGDLAISFRFPFGVQGVIGLAFLSLFGHLV